MLSHDIKEKRCLDFQENTLKRFTESHLKNFRYFDGFHPNGRSLFIQCEDGTKKKHIFYPKGADDHFKKLAHKPLTLPKLASLEKVCDDVGKLQQLRLKQDNEKLS